MKSNAICSFSFQTLISLSHLFPRNSLTFPAVGGSGKILEMLNWEPEKSRARLGPKSAGEGPGQGGVVRMGQDQDVVLGWRWEQWGGIYGE